MKVSNAPAKGSGRNSGEGGMGNDDGREMGETAPLGKPINAKEVIDPNMNVPQLPQKPGKE